MARRTPDLWTVEVDDAAMEILSGTEMGFAPLTRRNGTEILCVDLVSGAGEWVPMPTNARNLRAVTGSTKAFIIMDSHANWKSCENLENVEVYFLNEYAMDDTLLHWTKYKPYPDTRETVSQIFEDVLAGHYRPIKLKPDMLKTYIQQRLL